jgi:hypothetical protein
MRFKMGIALGFGAGYVLGARAGRYRYEQIVKGVKGMWSSPEMTKMREEAGRIAEQVQEQAQGAMEAVRERGNRKVSLDEDGLLERVEPYVMAANGPEGGALRHNKPLP